jgi:hypothetical protein
MIARSSAVHRELPPSLLQVVEAEQAALAIVAQAPWIGVDDVLEPRTLLAHQEQLVHLLLVLDHREARLRVADDVLHLLLDGVLVEGHRDPAERLRGEHGPVELWPVVAHHRRPVPAGEPERGQAEGDQAGLLDVLGPAVGLPDAEVLLADRDLVREALRVVQGELREGVQRRIEHQAPVTRRPRVHWATAGGPWRRRALPHECGSRGDCCRQARLRHWRESLRSSRAYPERCCGVPAPGLVGVARV